jgi:hypothetical protein
MDVKLTRRSERAAMIRQESRHTAILDDILKVQRLRREFV